MNNLAVMFQNVSVNNITEVQGFALSVTGMVIVFIALSVISIFITILPKVLTLLAKVMPEEEHGHGAPRAAVSDDALAVAIGAVLHKKLAGKD